MIFKKGFLIVALMLVTVLNANSVLTQKDIQAKHPKSLYTDKKLRVFSPYGKVYLHISTSVDGKIIPLPNKATVIAKKPVPVKLGRPGHHSIVHPFEGMVKGVNPDGKIKGNDPSRFMGITWDATAPHIKFSEKRFKFILDKNHYYFPLSAKFNLKSIDYSSGVNSTYLIINGIQSIVKAKNKEILFDKEGKYNLEIISVDNVGNVSKLFKRNLTIDNTAPKTSHDSKGFIEYDGKIIFGGKGVISLSSNDTLSGVKKIMYSIDNGKKHRYLTTLKPKNLKNGEHTLNYYSIDKVGNIEAKKSFVYTVDYGSVLSSGPSMKLKIIGDYYMKNKKYYVSSRSKVSLSASDSAGVKFIKYTLGKSKKAIYDKEFKFNLQGEKQLLKYYSSDNLNNLSVVHKREYIVDRFAPKPKINFYGKHVFDNGINYITDKTKIKLSGVDTLSGVKELNYKIEDGDTIKFTKSFSINKDTDKQFVLSSNATDNVNNISANANVKILVDTKGPRIISYFSLYGLKANPIKLANSDNKIPTYTNKTNIFIGAIDNAVGTKAIYYKLDNSKKWSVYTTPIKVRKFGKHTVSIQVLDRLGNRSKMVQDFNIVSYKDSKILPDNTPPLQFKTTK